ncbi:MAG: DUF362 domain-containing protein [Bradymonadales bacterium]|nr:DUF362 domain-containing protein [Bradymonadales bacterium]
MRKNYSRRDFLKIGAGSCLSLLVPRIVGCGDEVIETTTPTTVHALQFDDLSQLYDMAKQAAVQLGITRSSLTGATVFLKPNFLNMGMEVFFLPYDPMVGEATKAEVVAAVAEQCLEAGAARVTIGEGAHTTSWDWNLLTFCPGNSIEAATNLQTAVDRLKTLYSDDRIELACLNQVNQWERVPSSSDNAYVSDGLLVAKAFYEADHVISLPVMKTHEWAKITAAMKNYVGLAPLVELGNGMGRCKLHQAYAHATCHGVADAGIAGSFVDMHRWRMEEGKQDFAILDCSICLEGTGPLRSPVNRGITIDVKNRNAAGTYFLLAGDDLVAVDAVAAELMGFDYSQVKQLVMLDNLGFTSVRDHAIRGADLEDLRIPDWQPPVLNTEDTFFDHCD